MFNYKRTNVDVSLKIRIDIRSRSNSVNHLIRSVRLYSPLGSITGAIQVPPVEVRTKSWVMSAPKLILTDLSVICILSLKWTLVSEVYMKMDFFERKKLL